MSFFDFLKRKKPVAAATHPPRAPRADEPATTAGADVVRDDHPEARARELPAHDAMVDAVIALQDMEHDGPERRGGVRRNAVSGTKVLVIDDSPTIVALLRRMLQQNHFTVLEAFDAESGIELARREVPDLIFLDIVLPGMDGFNALRTLRRDPLTRHLPIIMISGNAQATEQFYVQRIGADDFMKKPFSRAEVFKRIEALLDGDGVPRHTSKPGTRAQAADAESNAG